MSSTTVNVSFPKRLLNTMDRVAKEEVRSRSELLREAVRLYIERKRRWEHIFALGRQQARRLRLKPEDVESRIAAYRRAGVPHSA